MSKKITRKALGRGLSNLIPVNIDNEDEKDGIHQVSVSSIKINPFQPRIDFNEDDIKGLAESIKNQGLLQPVVVRKKNDIFEIVSGERRFRAFKYLKRDAVPCIVKNNVSDREMLELALIENIQREELNDIEKALAYQKLILEYNYTHEELSEHIGKSRAVITNSLRLLNLPDEIQIHLRNNTISMGHARALLSVDEKEQQSVLERILKDHISVREVEEICSATPKKKNRSNGKKKNDTIRKDDPDVTDVIEKLQYKYGTAVEINSKSNKKGIITFRYLGNEDLLRLVDVLLK